MKPYNYEQTIFYHIGIVTLNDIIVYRLLVLDRSTQNNITECKQMIIIYKWEVTFKKKFLQCVTANWLKSQNGTLFLHVWRRGRLALDPL